MAQTQGDSKTHEEKTMKWRYKIPSAASVVAALTTIVPAKASKPCALGYYAHCSWTPWSTLICLAIAGAIYWLGKKRT